MAQPAIQTRSLCNTYGKGAKATVAVENLDLSVQPGEFLGLLGPNGAGKTTTIRMLCGLLSPTSGEAFIDGISLRDRPDLARALIGLVPEDAGDHRNLTLIEELCYYGALYGLRDHTVLERSRPLLARLDLTGKEESRVKTFSRGMRRKFHLIRALIHQPRVLLLDDPTAGLDPAIMEEVWDLLTALVHDQGVTVVLCSHHLEEVERLCDRVTIIQRKVLVEGRLSELSGGDRQYRLRLAMLTDDLIQRVGSIPGVESARALDGAENVMRFRINAPAEATVPEVVRQVAAAGADVLELTRDGRDLRALYRSAIGGNGETNA